MQITGGERKGTTLSFVPSSFLRPTSNKVRQALFNTLRGASNEMDTVLDLFAGTGAVGLEALSHGANEAVFVEKNSLSLKLLAENIRKTGYGNNVQILRMDALAAISKLHQMKKTFDFIFMDPPYEKTSLLKKCVFCISDLALLSEKGIMVVEHYKKVDLTGPFGDLAKAMEKKYGDTALTFFKRR